MIKHRIIENEGFKEGEWHKYYDILSEINVYDILWEYYGEEANGIDWELIDPNMYQKALSEFTRFGKLVHFPQRYVFQWMGMMMRNTAKLRKCTEVSGHDYYFPSDEVFDFFSNNEEILEKYKDVCEVDYDYIDQYGYDEWSEFLDETGFYDWMSLPDGSSAISDYGIEPLEKIISTYNENLSAEEVLVIINKMLDITHCRGDLASMFIVGGRKTLSQISEDVKKNKKVIINEGQVLMLKEYYKQTAFNFDDDGNAYFKKNNWQFYVDYLESIGNYGKLPKSQYKERDIEVFIRNEEDYAIKMAEEKSAFEEATEDYAMFRFLEDLLNKREDKDFSQYFTSEEAISAFDSFDEWMQSEQDGRFYNDTYVDERVAAKFLRDRLSIWYLSDFVEILSPEAEEELEDYRNSIFIDQRLDYDFPDSLVMNDRGLIYIERKISIPKYDSPSFNDGHDGEDDYYQHIKNNYGGVGECWSWREGFSDSYWAEKYSNGETDITLKGWVDPSQVNWGESLFRNCYDLRNECELFLNKETPIEIERAEIDDRNILSNPIIVYA